MRITTENMQNMKSVLLDIACSVAVMVTVTLAIYVGNEVTGSTATTPMYHYLADGILIGYGAASQWPLKFLDILTDIVFRKPAGLVCGDPYNGARYPHRPVVMTRLSEQAAILGAVRDKRNVEMVAYVYSIKKHIERCSTCGHTLVVDNNDKRIDA